MIGTVIYMIYVYKNLYLYTGSAIIRETKLCAWYGAELSAQCDTCFITKNYFYKKCAFSVCFFRSVDFVCKTCGKTSDSVLPLTATSEDTKAEIMNLAAQLSMTGEKPKAEDGKPVVVSGNCHKCAGVCNQSIS